MDVAAGGAGFAPQGDPHVFRPIRDAILYRYNDDAFEWLIYSESHDDVANGQSLIPQEVDSTDPTGWNAGLCSSGIVAGLVMMSLSSPFSLTNLKMMT